MHTPIIRLTWIWFLVIGLAYHLKKFTNSFFPLWIVFRIRSKHLFRNLIKTSEELVGGKFSVGLPILNAIYRFG